MPWPIIYHSVRPEQPKIGDMWPASWLLEMVNVIHENGHRLCLTEQYVKERMSRRPPLEVRLPDGTDFCIDMPYFTDGIPADRGWDVSGDPPKVTLSPSINIKNHYHGFIRDGVITDDVEGRKF